MENVLNGMFGTCFKTNQIEPPKKLPLYLQLDRTFYLLVDQEIKLVIVKINQNEKYGIIAYEKQLKQYIEAFELSVVFWFNKITRIQRDSMVNKKMPFISDDGQLYIPYLGMMFNNNFKREKYINTSKMMPITQMLFIYLLLFAKDKKMTKSGVAKILEVTKMSITRASEQLISMGLIQQEKKGKEYYIWLEGNINALFMKAKPFMINPIQKTITVDEEVIDKNTIISGETALSKKTMLNAPNIKTVAIYKKGNNNISPSIEERWTPSKQVINLEFWKYNPKLLAIDGMVDSISLYMSMQENQDERIEDALALMLEEMYDII